MLVKDKSTNMDHYNTVFINAVAIIRQTLHLSDYITNLWLIKLTVNYKLSFSDLLQILVLLVDY